MSWSDGTMTENKKRRPRLLPASPRQLKYLRLFLRKITYLLKKLYGPLIRRVARIVSSSDIRAKIFLLLAAVHAHKEWLFAKNAQKITKKYIHLVVANTSKSLKKTLEKNNLPFNPSATGVEVTSTLECVDRLRSIPGWFQLTLSHYVATEAFDKITEQNLEDLLLNRAKLITRTQISRAIAAENIARFQQAGLTHYVWRTSEDERVVGNPEGLYPKGNPGHEDHYHRDGKVFAFDNPPEDGHPGVPYNCRCVMLAVVRRK
jgi:uncharacterized protein with gpF-like domain